MRVSEMALGGSRRRRWPLGLVVLGLLAGCGRGPAAAGGATGRPVTVTLGYFPNITHAPAIVGVEKGLFARHLGTGVKLRTATFNAGPAAVEALFAGAVDTAYIGPGPAINGFVKSKGEAIRIVSGSTSGGASLVVRQGIDRPFDLVGKKLATPQLGNTQDVALRTWLRKQGLKTDLHGGGDVSIVPQDNAQTLETFRLGAIDGAWAPEPWATRLVEEGGGKVLVDEATLWPGGRFVTTLLVVRTEFLKARPDLVKRLVQGHIAAIGFINASPGAARRLLNETIAELTGKQLPDRIIARAWERVEFSTDPVASSLEKMAGNATALGLLDRFDLDGIYELALLNQLMATGAKPEVNR
ncbi:MAG: ABC transporter substrate-binding protein [Actinomycetota bacterium]